jgi:hypothetical protein
MYLVKKVVQDRKKKKKKKTDRLTINKERKNLKETLSKKKKISICKFYVYFYETVAQTSHKNIN